MARVILALDTSTGIAVALVRDGAVLAARRADEQRRHAELLTPMVADVLAAAGAEPAEVTTVVAGTGPAPFTGLRAGLVTARTLGFALGVPVLGVGSLDALAAAAFARGAVGDVVAVTDARRREVYTARFRAAGDDVEAVDGPAVLHPVDVRTDGAVVVGPGAALLGEPAPDAAPVDPAVLAALAVARAARGLEQPTEPLYLRRPDVTPAAERKRALG